MDLIAEEQKILDSVKREGKYAVVIASRPYQNDPLVNHELPDMFTSLGIPVLTADSIAEITSTDLSRLRLDAVNNFHSRMLSSAIVAAASDTLEYVQIVSFANVENRLQMMINNARLNRVNQPTGFDAVK